MNTDIDLTNTFPTASGPETSQLHSEKPAATRRGSGSKPSRRRRFTLSVIAAASVLGSGAGLLPATPASAEALVTPYFTLDAHVICDRFYNRVTVTVDAGAQPAYSGMTVQMRVYTEHDNLFGTSRSAQWTSWTAPAQLWNYRQVTNVTTYGHHDNMQYRVYVQMRYWTSYGWSAPEGTWASTYGISAVDWRSVYKTNGCYT